MSRRKFIIYYLNTDLLKIETYTTVSIAADEAIEKFSEDCNDKAVFLRMKEVLL